MHENFSHRLMTFGGICFLISMKSDLILMMKMILKLYLFHSHHQNHYLFQGISIYIFFG